MKWRIVRSGEVTEEVEADEIVVVNGAAVFQMFPNKVQGQFCNRVKLYAPDEWKTIERLG